MISVLRTSCYPASLSSSLLKTVILTTTTRARKTDAVGWLAIGGATQLAGRMNSYAEMSKLFPDAVLPFQYGPRR